MQCRARGATPFRSRPTATRPGRPHAVLNNPPECIDAADQRGAARRPRPRLPDSIYMQHSASAMWKSCLAGFPLPVPACPAAQAAGECCQPPTPALSSALLPVLTHAHRFRYRARNTLCSARTCSATPTRSRWRSIGRSRLFRLSGPSASGIGNLRFSKSPTIKSHNPSGQFKYGRCGVVAQNSKMGSPTP